MYNFGNNLNTRRRSSNISKQIEINFFLPDSTWKKWKIDLCDLDAQQSSNISSQASSIHLVSPILVYFLHNIATNMYFSCFLVLSVFSILFFNSRTKLKIMIIFFHFRFHIVFMWIPWLLIKYFPPKYVVARSPGSRKLLGCTHLNKGNVMDIVFCAWYWRSHLFCYIFYHTTWIRFWMRIWCFFWFYP